MRDPNLSRHCRFCEAVPEVAAKPVDEEVEPEESTKDRKVG